MKLLEFKNVKKSFAGDLLKGKRQVLKDVSFFVEGGKTTGFIGMNGSGKTTCLKCALGFIFPDSGEIEFFGEGGLTADKKKKIGFLPERPYFDDFLTAREFLHYHWKLAGASEGFETACESALTRVDLLEAKDRKLKAFSKGMLQRAGMAQAILLNPEFLILDEPMSGLDPDGRFLIKEIIRQQQGQGKTLFFSSHLLSDMEELCDNLVVIDNGLLLYQGSLKDFVTNQNLGLEKTFQLFKKGLTKK